MTLGGKFCAVCGKAKIPVDAGYFDTSTGQRATWNVCPDARCVRGCEERGSHKGSGWFGTGACRSCGSNLVSLCDAF